MWYELDNRTKRIANLSIHGTAFAFSETMVLTTNHNIKDNALKELAFAQNIYSNGIIDENAFYLMDIVDFDESDDWAVLKLRDAKAKFRQHLGIVSDKSQLPGKGSYLAIFDYPVGLLTSEDGVKKIECDSLMTSICWYEPRVLPTVKKMRTGNTFHLGSVPPDVINDVVLVKGDRSIYRKLWSAILPDGWNSSSFPNSLSGLRRKG